MTTTIEPQTEFCYGQVIDDLEHPGVKFVLCTDLAGKRRIPMVVVEPGTSQREFLGAVNTVAGEYHMITKMWAAAKRWAKSSEGKDSLPLPAKLDRGEMPRVSKIAGYVDALNAKGVQVLWARSWGDRGPGIWLAEYSIVIVNAEASEADLVVAFEDVKLVAET